MRTLLLLTPSACLFAAPGTVHAEDGHFDGPSIAAVAGIDETDAAPGRGAQSGFLYGGQIGYDVTIGSVVLGVQADLLASEADTAETGFASSADRYLTAAVRAGYLVTPRLLAFARGGIANARVETSLGTFDNTGFTVGGGLEYAVSHSIFLRGEYRYSDYGNTLRGQQYAASLGFRF